MTTLTEIHHVKAGNIARTTMEFIRPEGSTINVNPSTVVATVKDRNAAIIALTPSIDFASDGTSLIVTAEWIIPDAHPKGYYDIRFDVSGNLVAFDKVTIFVDPQ